TFTSARVSTFSPGSAICANRAESAELKRGWHLPTPLVICGLPIFICGLPVITTVIGPLLRLPARLHRVVAADTLTGTGKLFLVTAYKAF
ncbi:MAG: hypothetical protein ACRCUF_06200, partial [Aeromonas sobria]